MRFYSIRVLKKKEHTKDLRLGHKQRNLRHDWLVDTFSIHARSIVQNTNNRKGLVVENILVGLLCLLLQLGDFLCNAFSTLFHSIKSSIRINMGEITLNPILQFS